MRFLIAFICYCCFYVSPSFAGENNAALVIAKKQSSTHIITNTFSKKEIHSLSQEPFADHIERFHHIAIQHSLTIAVSEINDEFNFRINSSTTAKLLKRNAEYSYQFIFNCLYPKHTFW